MSDSIPVLVAHRGYPVRYPENTLQGICAALEAGACYVEFDIQLSSDGVPVLLHDEDLVRTGGVDVTVYDNTFYDLKKYSVGLPDRFGTQFAHTRIPSLGELVEVLLDWPRAQAFIELKRGSLGRFGRKFVLDAVSGAIKPVLDRCIIISFDSRVIIQAQQRKFCRTGWAIKSMNKRSCERAHSIAPDFLFFSDRLLPPQDRQLWSGPWQWVVYTINDPEQAVQLAQRGVRLIETDTIGDMLEHRMLKQGKCSGDGRL